MDSLPREIDTAATPAVKVDGLTKDFGDVQAVRGIDLTVYTGETFGFLGPNGAGKSTTIPSSARCLIPQVGRRGSRTLMS